MYDTRLPPARCDRVLLIKMVYRATDKSSEPIEFTVQLSGLVQSVFCCLYASNHITASSEVHSFEVICQHI